MRIQKVDVKNFRSLKHSTLDCSELTALVGANGSGKSSFLSALKLFYTANASVGLEDFYARDTSEPIEITLTFVDFSSAERERFEGYILNNSMSVTRVLEYPPIKGGGRYHATRLQNPDFARIRQESGNPKKQAYKLLRESGNYPDLPTANSGPAIDQAMSDWEEKYPTSLEPLLDQGQFFGFTNVANGYLGDVTKFIHIPAVRDLSQDAQESKDSAIRQILDMTVRAQLAESGDIEAIRKEFESRFYSVLDAEQKTQLDGIADALTRTLQQFYRNVGIEMDWSRDTEVSIPSPKADVRINEHGFSVPVTSVGHGLQRAFIISLLQHLVTVSDNTNQGSTDESNTPDRHLILAIEEPELFQHPGQQRVFSRVLKDLAQGRLEGVGTTTQVIFGTHSPTFVDVDEFEKIRLVQKKDVGAELPRETFLQQTNWSDVAEKMWLVDGGQGEKYSAESIRQRSIPLMSQAMNEGFFADYVVLVEGDGDRAAVLGAAIQQGIDLDAKNICVISCTGKTNIARMCVIFGEFNIPVYVIWDSDSRREGAGPRNNWQLLRAVGAEVVDWPSGVFENYAVFPHKLETTMREEIGEQLFDDLTRAECQKLGIRSAEKALKKSSVVASLLAEAERLRKSPKTLADIVGSIKAAHERVYG